MRKRLILGAIVVVVTLSVVGIDHLLGIQSTGLTAFAAIGHRMAWMIGGAIVGIALVKISD